MVAFTSRCSIRILSFAAHHRRKLQVFLHLRVGQKTTAIEISLEKVEVVDLRLSPKNHKINLTYFFFVVYLVVSILFFHLSRRIKHVSR